MKTVKNLFLGIGILLFSFTLQSSNNEEITVNNTLEDMIVPETVFIDIYDEVNNTYNHIIIILTMRGSGLNFEVIASEPVASDLSIPVTLLLKWNYNDYVTYNVPIRKGADSGELNVAGDFTHYSSISVTDYPTSFSDDTYDYGVNVHNDI